MTDQTPLVGPATVERRRPRTAMLLAPVVVGVVLVAGGATVDRAVARGEREAVERCAARALEAVRVADAAVAEGDAATDARAPVVAALAACEGTQLLGWHATEQVRRAGCVRLLELTRDHVDDVAAVGGPLPAPDRRSLRRDCAARTPR